LFCQPATRRNREGTLVNAMHAIDYTIYGDDMQFVEIELDPAEAAIAEAGGMMYMEESIEMETIFCDGSQQQSGFFGALMSAGKRLLTGESLFMTIFQNRGAGKQRVAFGAPYPGKIVPVHLAEIGSEIIAQKDSFLCAAKGVSVGIAFNRKIGAGLFGGEGFIMQRLQGDGWAFLHAGGTVHQRELATGKCLRVDTGCIVAASAKTGGGGREEGSMIGGLGRLLDGDNCNARRGLPVYKSSAANNLRSRLPKAGFKARERLFEGLTPSPALN